MPDGTVNPLDEDGLLVGLLLLNLLVLVELFTPFAPLLPKTELLFKKISPFNNLCFIIKSGGIVKTVVTNSYGKNPRFTGEILSAGGAERVKIPKSRTKVGKPITR